MELAGRVGDAFAERIRSLEERSLGPMAVRSYVGSGERTVCEMNDFSSAAGMLSMQ